MSRRFSNFTPLLPAYPTSTSQSFAAWYCTWKFQCCAYGVAKCGSITVRLIGAMDEKSKLSPTLAGLNGNGCAIGCTLDDAHGSE